MEGLGVQAEGNSRSLAPQGPLRVVHHAPEGETDGQIELAVAFDRPVVELGTMRSAEGVLQVEPSVPLDVRWLGSQTLLARSRQPLPMATHYRVSLNAGLKALDGHALEGSFGYTFSTPPPSVVTSAPGDGATHELPTRSIDLSFNQRVSPEQVKAHAKLSVKPAGGVASALVFEVVRPDPADPKRVRITPVQAFPFDASVTLRMDPELRGEEGPRPMAKPYQLEFKTFGPLRLTSTDPCAESGGRCTPSGGGTLQFSNPVHVSQVRKALRFEPALRKPLSPSEGDYTSEYVYLGTDLAPGTSYQIHIEGEIKDVFGNLLEGDRILTLKAGPYSPYLYFPLDGEVVPVALQPTLPLRVRNLPNVAVSMVALRADEIEPLVSGRTWLPQRAMHSVKVRGAGPRESRVVKLDPTPVLSSGKGVIVAYATQREGDPNAMSARTVLAFTDLAPTLKTWPKGGLVWVTQLSTAKIVSGAQVTIVDCGKQLAAGLTDAQGSFRFSRVSSDAECDMFAIVEKAGDLAFVRKYAGHGPWDLTSNTSYGGSSAVEGYLFTERGLYKPGERMRVKGVLQARGEKGFTPAHGKVKLRITDSQAHEIESGEVVLSEFGTFSYEARIPGSVPLGTLSVSASLGTDTFDVAAEVAEYRRAEIEAKIQASRPEYVRGETARVQLSAQYLFGAPVSNSRVIWTARRTESGRVPAGETDEGYSFGDETWWLEDVAAAEETALSGGEGKLDTSGELALSIPLKVPLAAGSAGVEIEATVEGLGGVTTSTRTLVTVTPAAFMLGLRASTSLAQAGVPFKTEVVAAKLSGANVLGVAAALTLTRRSYRQEMTQGDAGEAVMTQTHTDEPVASCSLKPSARPDSCTLTPKASGLHVLRVRSQDGQGRQVTAAIPLYVYGAGEASWAEGDTKVIALKANKKAYHLGETAQVLVPSPFSEAEAWITIEREGVLSVERRHLRGGAPVLSIAIDERFAPNAFVSVLLIRGTQAATRQDAGRPDYRVGTLELRADVSKRHLRVDVRPDSEEKEPGQEVSVSLAVTDGEGKALAAELTVFAVDEGVLALSGYKTPDPFARMYAPQGLAVWTSDSRARLIQEADGEDEKGGSEAGGGGATLRRDFESVAFYAPDVQTDAAGKAKIKFKLPDSLTRYRIMAVAVSRTAELGSGDASVRTHKPLMVRPMLPRVIRVGDVLEAGATLQTESEKPIQITVTADVTGLSIEGPVSRTLKVSKRKSAEIRFKMRAAQVGPVRLRVTAKGGKLSDGFEVTRAVLAANAMETVSTSGQTADRRSERLGTLSDARRDTGGLEVSLSTSALSALEAPVRALLEYEYGCTEQLSSRMVGLTAQARLAKLGVLAAPDTGAQAEKVLISIERRQRSDGSFALWDDDRGARFGPLDAFLTGYALFALQKAEEAGFAPSRQARDAARAWLASYLRAEVDPTQRLSDADRVFVLYALALSGAPDKSYAGTFLERQTKLPLISRVELAHTLTLAGDTSGAQQITDDLVDRLRITADEAHLEENLGDAYQTLMVSDVRTTAEYALLLTARNKDDATLPRLARWLSNAREASGDWGTTQENAWALLALSSYLEAAEAVQPQLNAQVGLDGQRLFNAQLAGRTARAQHTVAMSELPEQGARIDVSRKGQGRLYYNLRLTYAKRELPMTPREQGFFVEREYERVDPVLLARGDPRGVQALRAQVGDYVRVTLRVAVPVARRFVVIEDPVPAGLEPMNFGITTESQAAAAALGIDTGPLNHAEIRDDKVVFAMNELSPGLYRYTYLARAVTPGAFVAPPARAEEMYHPETFGRTAAVHFEVVTR